MEEQQRRVGGFILGPNCSYKGAAWRHRRGVPSLAPASQPRATILRDRIVSAAKRSVSDRINVFWAWPDCSISSMWRHELVGWNLLKPEPSSRGLAASVFPLSCIKLGEFRIGLYFLEVRGEIGVVKWQNNAQFTGYWLNGLIGNAYARLDSSIQATRILWPYMFVLGLW